MFKAMPIVEIADLPNIGSVIRVNGSSFDEHIWLCGGLKLSSEYWVIIEKNG